MSRKKPKKMVKGPALIKKVSKGMILVISSPEKGQKKMPEESGVGTVAEWGVPSSGIKRRFQLRTCFSCLFSSHSYVSIVFCFRLCFFSLKSCLIYCDIHAMESVHPNN
jgi:hypothetical protein